MSEDQKTPIQREFEAAEACWKALSALDDGARQRVATWLGQKLQEYHDDPRLLAQAAVGRSGQLGRLS